MSSDRLKAVHKVRNFFHSRSRSRGSDKGKDEQGTSKDRPTTDDGVSSSAPTSFSTTSTEVPVTKRVIHRTPAQDVTVPASDELERSLGQTAPSSQYIAFSYENSRTLDQNTPSVHGHAATETHEALSKLPEDTPQKVDIWKLAYLRLSEKKPSLVKHYEQILAQEEAEEADLSTQTQATQPEITDSVTRLTNLASKKLTALDDSRFKIRLRSKTFVVKDGVDQALTVVIAAKDFVSGIVASEPHAALAWAGVCVLLPVS